MKIQDVKKGLVVEYNGQIYSVRDVERSAPTARGGNTTFRVQMFSIPGNQKIDLSLRADDELTDIELLRRQSSFSYKEENAFVFMDNETYNQYILDADLVGDAAAFVVAGIDSYFIQLIDDQPIALQLPQSVILEIVDTAPELKSASATKRTKPATLVTGFEVQVPEYIMTGEHIRINTETREFMGRA